MDSTLETFPVVSIEIVNLPQLVTKWLETNRLDTVKPDPSQIERVRVSCLTAIEERLIAGHGDSLSVHANTVFANFSQASNTLEAVYQGLKAASNLLMHPVTFLEEPIQLKIGMDMDETSAPSSSIISTTERSIAPTDSVVVSEQIFRMTRDILSFEPLGPVRVGNQMQSFYKMKLSEAIDLIDFETISRKQQQQVQQPIQQQQVPSKPVNQEETTVSTHPSQSPPRQEPVIWKPLPFGQLGTQPIGQANITYENAITALETELKSLNEQHPKKGVVLGISGRDGLGKSTMIQIARSQLPPESLIWIEGSFYRSYGRDPIPPFPQEFFVQLIHQMLNVSLEGSHKENLREQLRGTLPAILGNSAVDEDTQLFYETMLALRQPEPLTLACREKFGWHIHHLYQLLTKLSQNKPVVLVMEDLQFADSTSIDTLLHLLQADLLETPVLIILTYDTTFRIDGELKHALDTVPFKEWVVANRNESGVHRYLELPLSNPDIPEFLFNQLVQNSEGCGLYLEEALRLLYQMKILLLDEQHGKFHLQPQAELPILPYDIPKVIEARINTLDQTAHYVLQMAAVMGERFMPGILKELSQTGDDFDTALKVLWEQGFIIPDIANGARFRHGQLWKAIYDSISNETRQQIHQLFAEFLENAKASDVTVAPFLIAQHAQLGGLVHKALNAWNMAGIQQVQLGSLEGANNCFFQATTLLNALDNNLQETMGFALIDNLAMLNMEDNPELAIQLLKKAMTMLGSNSNQRARLVELRGYLATCYEKKGQFSEALALLDEIIRDLPSEHFPSERISVFSLKIDTLRSMGRMQQARSFYERELSTLVAKHPITQQDPVIQSSYWSGVIGYIDALLSQLDNQVFPLVEEGIQAATALHRPDLVIGFQLKQVAGFLQKGQYDSAERLLQLAMENIETLPNRERHYAQWGLYALINHSERGDWESASLLATNTLYQAEQSQDYLTWLMTQNYIGRLAYGKGNYLEARKILESAILLSSEYKLATPALVGWRFLAEAELRLQNVDLAESLVTQAIVIADKEEIQNLYESYLLKILLGEILINRSCFQEAGKMLEAEWPLILRSNCPPLMARSATQVGRLYHHIALEAPPQSANKYRTRSTMFFEKALQLWQSLGNRYEVQAIRAMGIQ